LRKLDADDDGFAFGALAFPDNFVLQLRAPPGEPAAREGESSGAAFAPYATSTIKLSEPTSLHACHDDVIGPIVRNPLTRISAPVALFDEHQNRNMGRLRRCIHAAPSSAAARWTGRHPVGAYQFELEPVARMSAAKSSNLPMINFRSSEPPLR
jgi:hypothetical protein